MQSRDEDPEAATQRQALIARMQQVRSVQPVLTPVVCFSSP